MSLSSPTFWTALVIAAAMILGVVRLVLWHRKAEPQGPRWRTATLMGLTVLAGLLLWLTLNPPASIVRTGTLIVATAGAPGTVQTGPGDILVALPEAGPVTDATRVPDLATALRRYPTPARIRILDQGLTPRDQSPLPVPVEFTAPPLPRGFTDLSIPEPTEPGATFVVGGQVGSLAAGTVELVDPADEVVDTARVAAGERFALMAAARAPGLALFTLRLRDAAGIVEQIAVPIETVVLTPPRVLVLAGAPGAESKYLKRWAEDSGIELTVDIDVGGGVQLGDPPAPLTAATFGELDLVVLDDRRWEAMGGGQRAALTAAVNGGMGLLLRPTGPLSAKTRRDWAGLGLALSGGDEAVSLRLDPPEGASPGTDVPAEPVDDTEALPELARRDLTVEGSGAIALLRDADGIALASWRGLGRGRVGVWTVTDSYALVLTGRPDRYGEMWSALFSEIGRAGDHSRAEVQGLARAGQRVALCRLIGQPNVLGQDGRAHALRIDPATGDRACAAFWPEQPGWHVIRDGEDRQTPFYVQPADAAPSLVLAANRSATLALAGTAPTRAAPPSSSHAPGSPWPWFVGLLIVLSGLWWFERNRDVGALIASLRARFRA